MIPGMIAFMTRPQKIRNVKQLADIAHFYTIRLPFVCVMVPVGFLFEFLVTFPYIVLTAIDGRRQAKRTDR